MVAGIPVEAAEKSSHVAIVVTSRGGHIGFMEGMIPTNTYYSDRLYKQLVSAVFANLDQVADVCAEGHTHVTQTVVPSESGKCEPSSSSAAVTVKS